MKTRHTQQAGITLVEMMLVLTVSAVIIVMGIRQYQSYDKDKEVSQVLYNVDILARAAANFYWANCGAQLVGTSTFSFGRLHPLNASPPSPYFPLNITTDLSNKGYLLAPLVTTPNSITTTSGYSVQLNQSTSQKKVEACDDGTCATTSPHVVGTNVFWRIQISVAVSNPSLERSQALRDQLGAECVSSLSGSTVLPCSSAPASATTYLVFTRSPSNPVPGSSSPFSNTAGNRYMYNQPYVTNNIINLTSGDHSTEYQYFVCSGY